MDYTKIIPLFVSDPKEQIKTYLMYFDKFELSTKFIGTLTPNGSFSMGMIQKVGTSFNHVGGFQ